MLIKKEIKMMTIKDAIQCLNDLKNVYDDDKPLASFSNCIYAGDKQTFTIIVTTTSKDVKKVPSNRRVSFPKKK